MLTKTLSKFSIGQTASIKRTFTEEDVKLYMALTGDDDNPVYSNDDLMRNVNFKGAVVPGLLSEGLIMEVGSKKLIGTAALILQKELVYLHPVYIGDTITAQVEIIDIDLKRSWITLRVRCINQFGKEVLKGQLVIFVITDMNE